MHQHRSLSEKLFEIFNICFLLIIVLLCLYPVLHVLFASFSEPDRLMQHRGLLISPLGFTVKGYEMVFKNKNILLGYQNTLTYVIAGTFVNLLMTSIGAYVVSRKNFLAGNTIMMMITFTMFFSGGLIPSYLLVSKLGWINSRAAVIIPKAIDTMNLIIMRTSFKEIPDSLEESARLDGAGDFTILFRIVLPLSKALLAVMTLFYAVGHWNAWFHALIYLRDRKLWPLQLFLREILVSADTTSMNNMSSVPVGDFSLYKQLVQYTTIVVSTAPILCLYPFLQKYFVKGVMIGALKG